jgi:hypothetical protein
MPINQNTLDEINVALTTLSKVLTDVQGVLPASTPAAFALNTAALLLPTVGNIIIAAVQAAEQHAGNMPKPPLTA